MKESGIADFLSPLRDFCRRSHYRQLVNVSVESLPSANRRTGAVQEPHVAGQVARKILPNVACSQKVSTSANPLIV